MVDTLRGPAIYVLPHDRDSNLGERASEAGGTEWISLALYASSDSCYPSLPAVGFSAAAESVC